MASATWLLEAPDLAGSPARTWSNAGRLAAATILVLGAAFQLAAFLTEPSTPDVINRLKWIAGHPDQANLAKLLDVLAMPFLFGTAVVYVLLARKRSPRLAYAGGALLGCGFVGLSASQGFEVLEFSLAEKGGVDLNALAGVVDNVSTPASIAMLLMFLPGAFFGLLTLAVALWRSGAVARGAVILIPAFIVTDFFLQLGVVGHAISFVTAGWMASAVLLAGRTSSGRASVDRPNF